MTPRELLGRLSERDRRALLLGLAVLVPSVAYLSGLQPYLRALGDARDRLVIERELLGRELALIESAHTLPIAIDRLERKAWRNEQRIVQVASDVLAEAVLTDQLELTAAASRVLLEGIRRVEPPRGEEAPAGLSVVRLTVTGESDLQGVLTFIDGIEGHQYFMRLRGFALEPQMSRPQQGRRAGNNNSDRSPPRPTGVVEFQLIVEGYARIASAAPEHPNGS